jgi:pre-rRNA-processing protein TSR4
MPPYDDSDSSDDGDDYSTTNVTLGYASKEPTGDDVSHVGGLPSWLDPDHTPPATLAKCKVCNGYLSLLLQLNADLQQHFPHDVRRLHVLCCRKKTCSKKIGSVRAFREVKKAADESIREKKKESHVKEAPTSQTNNNRSGLLDIGNALFGGTSAGANDAVTANPFALPNSGAQSPSPANPFASLGSPSSLAAIPPQRPVDEPQPQPPIQSFADKLKIGSDPKKDEANREQQTTETWPEQSLFPPPFAQFYLDAYPEELEKEQPEPLPAGSSKTEYDVEDSGNASALDKDTFESSLDKTFQKFSDRIAQNPEQVLRYEFRGEPLLYSGTDGVASRFVVPHGKSGAVRGIPRCESCGARRAFELQLVPGLIYELEKEDDSLELDDGMEWGTVLVGTCVNNCGQPGDISFREEWVGVQWEERVVRK